MSVYVRSKVEQPEQATSVVVREKVNVPGVELSGSQPDVQSGNGGVVVLVVDVLVVLVVLVSLPQLAHGSQGNVATKKPTAIKQSAARNGITANANVINSPYGQGGAHTFAMVKFIIAKKSVVGSAPPVTGRCMPPPGPLARRPWLTYNDRPVPLDSK